jgi:DNA polymerase III subunit delta
MGALTFDALLRSLKRSAPDPAYYLHGDEDVLKDEAIRALIDRAVEPGARDFNVDQRSAAALDPEAFHTLVNTPPLLAQTRAVIVRGLDQVKKTSALYKEIVRYLAAPNPSTVLILTQGAGESPDAGLVKDTTSVAVEPLPPDRVARWMGRRAGELGLVLEPDAGHLLLEAVGHDLGFLARELDKLAALTGGRPGTRSDVAALVGVRRGETLSDLVEAALTRRPPVAARLVEPVLAQAGMSGVRVVTALGTALIGTALARAEQERGVTVARLPDVVFRHILAARPFGLGNWKDEAARWARWSGHWQLTVLRHALRRTLAADYALKSSTLSDDQAIVTELLLTWVEPAREAA